LDCPALTNDHETDDHGARTSSLKSRATSDEETCADSAAAEIKSACALVQILIRKANESSIKESLSKLDAEERRGRKESFSWKDLHGNHLHVSPFQPSVQLALIGFDNGYIAALDTELAATQMGAQTGRFDRIRLGPLLRIRENETFSASAHLWTSTRSRSTVEIEKKFVWRWEEDDQEGMIGQESKTSIKLVSR
jgi:hypothetical protein